MMETLYERVADQVLSIVEARTPAGLIRVKGEFGRVDAKNQNGRIYERRIMENALKLASEDLTKRRMLGELDHPAEGKTSLWRVSHLIEDLKIREDGVIEGSCVILNTPGGKIMQALIEANAAVGISSRASGSVTRRGDADYVNEDLRLKTFDFVVDPSVKTAYPLAESLNESIREVEADEVKMRQILSDNPFLLEAAKDMIAGDLLEADDVVRKLIGTKDAEEVAEAVEAKPEAAEVVSEAQAEAQETLGETKEDVREDVKEDAGAELRALQEEIAKLNERDVERDRLVRARLEEAQADLDAKVAKIAEMETELQGREERIRTLTEENATTKNESATLLAEGRLTLEQVTAERDALANSISSARELVIAEMRTRMEEATAEAHALGRKQALSQVSSQDPRVMAALRIVEAIRPHLEPLVNSPQAAALLESRDRVESLTDALVREEFKNLQAQDRNRRLVEQIESLRAENLMLRQTGAHPKTDLIRTLMGPKLTEAVVKDRLEQIFATPEIGTPEEALKKLVLERLSGERVDIEARAGERWQARLEAVEADLATAREEIQRHRENLAIANVEKASVEAARKTLQDDLARMRGAISETIESFSKLETELAEVKSDRDRFQAEVSAMKRQMEEARTTHAERLQLVEAAATKRIEAAESRSQLLEEQKSAILSVATRPDRFALQARIQKLDTPEGVKHLMESLAPARESRLEESVEARLQNAPSPEPSFKGVAPAERIEEEVSRPAQEQPLSKADLNYAQDLLARMVAPKQ
jgi:chromosome segregation ATPase